MTFDIEVFDTNKKCVFQETDKYKAWVHAERRADFIVGDLEREGIEVYKFTIKRTDIKAAD